MNRQRTAIIFKLIKLGQDICSSNGYLCHGTATRLKIIKRKENRINQYVEHQVEQINLAIDLINNNTPLSLKKVTQLENFYNEQGT